MDDVSIAEVKAHLSDLVARAEAGEAIRITRRGKPVAMLGEAVENIVPSMREPARY